MKLKLFTSIIVCSTFTSLMTACKKDAGSNNSTNSIQNLYIVGAKNGMPVYWQGDSAYALTTNNGWANAVYTSNGNIYISGDEFLNGNYTASYWKNGTVPHLTGKN